MKDSLPKHTNLLKKENSPYLQQHAHNPVNWLPWSEDVFELAKKENKMVLVSVGYSACHWCHVMEHECFEDEEVAELMNKYFINVKVDREERPDVDQVYMTAVQIMTQKGGWPLNCFTLPDGRPVYGGTYFPKNQWMHILKSLQHVFENDKVKIEETANNITEGVNQSELISEPKSDLSLQESHLTELVQRWSKSFDTQYGGPTRAPKFMLPNNFTFLLEYALSNGKKDVLDYVELSLDKMALGGIYDQVVGGFSRYSVDMLWKVPHFEKMLYDNGQLIELYSEAYRIYKKPLYKRLVFQTIDWLNTEMKSEKGGYYSALDADSEGEEGKFYVWKEDELKSVLGEYYSDAEKIYAFNDRGFWEEGNFILLRTEDDQAICQRENWSIEEFEKKLAIVNDLLQEERKNRIRPGLDNKRITSWNAILLKGLIKAYVVFDDVEILSMINNINGWIEGQFEGGNLLRIKDGNQKIDAFLEDYAHYLSALIDMYLIDFNEEWLFKAECLMREINLKFKHDESEMYYFTDDQSTLIARKMEINDNVIPATNSVMALNNYRLGHYLSNKEMIEQSKQMLVNVYDGMENYGSGYSNWALLLNNLLKGTFEVASNSKSELKKLIKDDRSLSNVSPVYIHPDSKIISASDKKTIAQKFSVCTEGTCFAPTNDINEVFNLIK